MQILLIMLIVIFLAFSVLLLALAKQSPREKQTEDKEQEEYIRDYAETVRQTGGSMKKLEHWKVIAIYLIIYIKETIECQTDFCALLEVSLIWKYHAIVCRDIENEVLRRYCFIMRSDLYRRIELCWCFINIKR